MKLSAIRKILAFVAFATLALPICPTFSGQAILQWDPPVNTDGTPVSNLAGFKVYYGTAAGVYSQNVSVGNVLTTSLNLADGKTYFFAATALNTGGSESGFSNEVSKYLPPVTVSYTITPSAGSGGSISPSSAVTVASGGNQTFTMTAASGYKILDVKVDGTSFGAIGSYTFSNVAANHAIAASFAVIPTPTPIPTFTITASAGSGGAINPSGSIVLNQGASQAFAIIPNAGFQISDVKVDGASVGAVSYYNFTNLAANHSIAASFSAVPTPTPTPIPTFTISASAGSGGAIAPSGSVIVSLGGSKSFSISASSGYKIADVKVDGASVGTVSSYSFSNVTANHSIAASFAVIPTPTPTPTPPPAAYFTISASAVNDPSSSSLSPAGSISPSGSISIASGGSKTFSFSAVKRHRLVSVVIDGVAISIGRKTSSYTFSNVNANHTIVVTFK